VIKDHNYNQFFVKKTAESPEAYTSTIELGIEGVQLQSENVSQSDDSWRYGRRVVELSVLADGLKACRLCSQPLHLADCVGETRYGLSGYLKVKCMYSECGLMNQIPTGSRHGKIWDANTKLASGNQL